MHQVALSFEHSMTCQVSLSYLRHLPEDYGKDPQKKWPLILFLHGAGERGSDLDLVKKHGIARVVEERDLPFVTLAPQCPLNRWWSDFLPALNALLDQTVASLNIDPDRIYLTGLSMGGFGTWHMAAEYPNRFAAIAPICAGVPWMYGFPDRVSAIKHLPIWVFHGAKDEVISIDNSEEMVAALRDCGSDACFTIYPEAGHDSWTATYNNPALYDWFLSHQLAG